MKIVVECEWEPTRDGAELKSGPLTLAKITAMAAGDYVVSLATDGGMACAGRIKSRDAAMAAAEKAFEPKAKVSP